METWQKYAPRYMVGVRFNGNRGSWAIKKILRVIKDRFFVFSLFLLNLAFFLLKKYKKIPKKLRCCFWQYFIKGYHWYHAPSWLPFLSSTLDPTTLKDNSPRSLFFPHQLTAQDDRCWSRPQPSEDLFSTVHTNQTTKINRSIYVLKRI